MHFCQSCRDWLKLMAIQHPKATRWVAFCLALSLFFTVLGWFSDPVNGIGFCRVYF